MIPLQVIAFALTLRGLCTGPRAVVPCGEFPTGGQWRNCQMGNDRSDSRTTASKCNTSHPNVNLLYKSQPYTDCFNNKNNQYMRYCKSLRTKRFMG